MVAGPAEDEAALACLAALEASLARGGPSSMSTSADFPSATLETALEALVLKRGSEALAVVTALAEGAPHKDTRKAARRALYRLRQAGFVLPRSGPRPVVERQPERALQAWVSGVDGTGSRAIWIVFEGSFGGLSLCAVIVNDQAGILEAAGGAISKKRLEQELHSLRETQKLPWLRVEPERATAPVEAALALHERLGTEPPPEFARWRRLFADTVHAAPLDLGPATDEDDTLREHSGELLDLPELASWFLDPAELHAEALELLQAKDSRLVLSTQQKAEREAAIVERVVDRVLTTARRTLWAQRLVEMASIFEATGRDRGARLAYATARALEDAERPLRHLPFARVLAERGLAFASEVALGRVSATEVSRTPRK